ncbi:MAG: hemolysin-type calcium-binding repeat family protein [Rhizobium sp.]|nr:hemolysin-type calcium-binding repeat family protein [Rhizobium sp.]
MAFLRFNDADAPFDMTSGTNTFEGTINTSATQWQFSTGSAARAIAFGEGMSFDVGNKPTGGTVTELQLRVGTADTSDADVSGFSVSATLLRDNNVWDVILSGNDIINTQGLAVDQVGAGSSSIFGDSSLAKDGTAGGNDIFIIGDSSVQLIGDAAFMGEPISNLQRAQRQSIDYLGGNDTINGVVATVRQIFVGDVGEAAGAVNLSGGDDLFNIGTSFDGSAVTGDVQFVQGGGRRSIAEIRGGEDEIRAVGTNAELLLAGDVGVMSDFTVVRGGKDVIAGNDGADVISGDVASDASGRKASIRGGADQIDGGDGDDRIPGESLGFLEDLFPKSARAGDRQSGSAQIKGAADVIDGGGGDDEIYGELFAATDQQLKAVAGGNDVISGGTGNDELFGQSGNDRIIGGIGGDILSGGTGADHFVFLTLEDSRFPDGGQDLITDFSRKERDRIDLSAIDADLTKDGVQDFDFVGRTDRTGPTGELSLRFENGTTTLTADTSGDTITDFGIAFEGRINFRDTDFIF